MRLCSRTTGIQEAKSEEENNLRGSPSAEVVGYNAEARGLRGLLKRRKRRKRIRKRNRNRARGVPRVDPHPEKEETVDECFKRCKDKYGSNGLFTRNLKRNAPQKRQDQRDKRRADRGGTRTKYEECRERCRKHMHGKNRTPRADPYELGFGEYGYAVGRENRRKQRCAAGNMEACGWNALNWDDPIGHQHKAYDYDPVHGYDYGGDWPFWP